MKTTILPENILRRMEPKDRVLMGKAGRTALECEAKNEAKCEKELQDAIEGLLRLRGIIYLRQPMHKKSLSPVGSPDFTIVLKGGKCLMVECKTLTGKLSPEQEAWHLKYMQATGEPVFVIRTVYAFKQLLDLEENK